QGSEMTARQQALDDIGRDHQVHAPELRAILLRAFYDAALKDGSIAIPACRIGRPPRSRTRSRRSSPRPESASTLSQAVGLPSLTPARKAATPLLRTLDSRCRRSDRRDD